MVLKWLDPFVVIFADRARGRRPSPRTAQQPTATAGASARGTKKKGVLLADRTRRNPQPARSQHAELCGLAAGMAGREGSGGGAPRPPRTRDRLLSLGGDSDLTWRSRGGTATTVPGFSSAGADLPAARDPKQAHELLCAAASSGSGPSSGSAAAGGIALRQWLRLAPTMGLADLVTAESTFQLLAKLEEGDELAAPRISLTSLALYSARIEEKAAPGADHVSGWLHGDSADSILLEAEPALA